MKLLDTYATATGSTIDRPFIFDMYFPVSSEKYITIQSSTTFDSRNYSLWQDIIDILAPTLLDEGITVIQVGLKDEVPLSGVNSLLGSTSINQLAYIIKHSLLHIGPDSFCTHLAASYDVPLLGLFSSNHINISKPCFGSEKNQILIESYSRVGNKKPSYSVKESPKSINLIKPEEIIDGILSLLKIEKNINLETLSIGDKYPEVVVDFVPDSPSKIPIMGDIFNVRFDLLNDPISDGNLHSALINIKERKSTIVTNVPMDLEVFTREPSIKKNLELVIFSIDQKNIQNVNLLFKCMKETKSLGFRVAMALVKNNFSREEIDQLKLEALDFGRIAELDETSWEKSVGENWEEILDENCIFKSSRVIYSKGKAYLSKAAFLGDCPSKVREQNLFEIKNWKNLGNELEYCYIYKK